jgi:pimeloyl-ACP methyl ester carboxylesterase
MAFGRGMSDRSSHPGGRLWRIAKIIGIVAVALVLTSTLFNLIQDKREKARFVPYGERVSVPGGSLNVWRNGHAGRTIVMLSGLGTAAPALDFAPLVRQLSNYNVIVVEGFGYGYSDMSAPPRTVQNITTELHDVLMKLGVKEPYVLLGHSIGGFYTLSYAHRYPGAVSAVIGIDPTVPAAKAASGGTSGLLVDVVGGALRALRTIGVVRAAFTIDPSLADPQRGAYTADELARIHAMAIWNFGNPAVTDETARVASNARALRGIAYPDGLPVLTFLSTHSIATIPHWAAQHEAQLRNVRHHKIVVLAGGHYLQWTKSKVMAEKITEFLSRNTARP